jgi:HSP20 family protein
MAAVVDMIEVKTSKAGDMKRAILDEMKSNLAEWLDAKDDPFWNPPIEMTEENGEFTVRASVGGADLEDVEVMVLPEMMLIKGEFRNHTPETTTIHLSEFPHGKLRRTIEFPRPVNPDRLHAEMKNGMLSVTAEIAGARRSRFPMLRAA